MALVSMLLKFDQELSNSVYKLVRCDFFAHLQLDESRMCSRIPELVDLPYIYIDTGTVWWRRSTSIRFAPRQRSYTMATRGKEIGHGAKILP